MVVLAVPPVEELDLVGPMTVMSAANRLSGKSVYQIEVVTSGKDLRIEGEGGLSFHAHGHYQDVKSEIDSLLIVCGLASRTAHDPALFTWLKARAPAVRRLGAVCVGSFLLAAAGVLNGRRATSHWKFGQELARRYPKVCVEHDPIWVRDGNIYTSAGISAGIDLALAWVEEDCGNTIAVDVARELVLFLRRPAHQTQTSVSLSAQATEMKAIQELQVWIAENLHKRLSVAILADRVAMSTRNFMRVFSRELGMAPARYIRELRLEAARRQLERSDRSLSQIASACGFGSADLMRRAFRRASGSTPSRLRRRFASHRGAQPCTNKPKRFHHGGAN